LRVTPINVSSVVFSPDGKYIASGSYDTTAVSGIRTRARRCGSLKATPICHSVAISPDGRYIASGSGARLPSVSGTGTQAKQVRGFEGNTSGVTSVASARTADTSPR